MIGSGDGRGSDNGEASSFRVRVFELAKEFGLAPKDMVAKIRTLGVEVANHMSNLDAADAYRVKLAIIRERQQEVSKEIRESLRIDESSESVRPLPFGFGETPPPRVTGSAATGQSIQLETPPEIKIPQPVVTGSAATGQFIQLPGLGSREGSVPKIEIKDRDEELRRMGRGSLISRGPGGRDWRAPSAAGQQPGGPAGLGQPEPTQPPDLLPPSSERLLATIESRYPFAIAKTARTWRNLPPEDWLGRITRLEPLFDQTLRHLMLVALAEYLATDSRTRELRTGIRETLAKPGAFGTFKWLLDLLVKKQGVGVSSSLATLRSAYFEKQTPGNLVWIMNEAIRLRNLMVKKSEAQPPTKAMYDQSRTLTLELLRELTFLCNPIVCIRSATRTRTVWDYDCVCFNGPHEDFESFRFQTDLTLESGRVMLVDEKRNGVLDLHPLFVYRNSCPRKECGRPHLYLLQSLDDRAKSATLTAVAATQHEIQDGHVWKDLAGLLDTPTLGRWSQSRYLKLPGAEPLVAGIGSGTLVGNGKYKVVRSIKSGGQADVYEVEQLDTGAHLAMKMLSMTGAAAKQVLQRFDREYEAMKGLDDDHIIRPRERGSDGMLYFIVMELAEGWKNSSGTARDVGELSKPLEERRVVDIAKQVCKGLAYLHSHGYVHRDIKPGNLLLCAGEQVKIGDFGIAYGHHHSRLTSTGQPLGTAAYMAPEQDGVGTVDATSDIYSLGAVLFELLTGEVPFEGLGFAETLIERTKRPARRVEQVNASISSRMVRIVNRCLERERKERYASALDLLRAFEEWKPDCMTLSGHDGPVQAVAIRNDGALAVSGGEDGTLKVWNLETGKCTKTLRGHEGRVNCVVITEDGRSAFSGGADWTVRRWNLETGESVRVFSAHAGEVVALATSASGSVVLSGCEDDKLRIWNGDNGACMEVIHGVDGVAGVGVFREGDFAVSVTSGGDLRLWNIYRGQYDTTFAGELFYESGVLCLALVWDSRTKDPGILVAGEDGVLSALGCDQMDRLYFVQTLTKHEDSLWCVAMSGDQRLAAAGDQSGMVMFWDTSTGGESKMEVRHTCGVTGIAVSSDGHRAVSASEDGTLIVWHLEDIIEQIARDHAQDSDRENDDPEDSDTASASQSGDEADDRSEDDDDDSCVGPGWRSSRRGRRGERW